MLTPLFGVPVPVLAHDLAEPDKGSGIAMICTFGDLTDVTWWRDLALPTRSVVGRDGRLGPAPFGTPGWESADADRANTSYAELEGIPVKRAASRIVEMLRAVRRSARRAPCRSRHPVKYYERGKRPLEIVTSSQWYVRTLERREALLARGRELHWHPEYMRARYEAWVEGLTGDWNISTAAFLRRAVPGLVSRSTRTARSSPTASCSPPRRACRSTRRPTYLMATARTSAANPGGSSVTRTSWTRGRPRR